MTTPSSGPGGFCQIPPPPSAVLPPQYMRAVFSSLSHSVSVEYFWIGLPTYFQVLLAKFQSLNCVDKRHDKTLNKQRYMKKIFFHHPNTQTSPFCLFVLSPSSTYPSGDKANWEAHREGRRRRETRTQTLAALYEPRVPQF